MIVDKKTRCNGGGGLPHIAAELVSEILSRLPIVALYRAQTVCKAWRAIITSPEFIQTLNLRRRNRKPSLGLLFSAADNETREFVFYYARLQEKNTSEEETLDEITPPRFVCRSRVPFSDYAGFTQVVHGVVCLFSNNRASLLNICTREIIHLPKPPFYPCSSSLYHLGFDTSRNVYKLLRVSRLGDNDYFGLYRVVCEILTIATPISSSKWRRLEYHYRGIGNISLPEFTHCFWANGTLYWMYKFNSRLFAFHLDNETFNFAYTAGDHFSCPEGPEHKVLKKSKLMQSGQFLGLLHVSSCSGKLLQLRSLLRFEPAPMWATNAIDLPAELCGDCCRDVIPVGTLSNGDTLLANDSVNDCFTPVYSHNSESKRSQRFVVGKFPWSVAGMSQMERASCITCLEEDLTPLQVLLGSGSDSD